MEIGVLSSFIDGNVEKVAPHIEIRAPRVVYGINDVKCYVRCLGAFLCSKLCY